MVTEKQVLDAVKKLDADLPEKHPTLTPELVADELGVDIGDEQLREFLRRLRTLDMIEPLPGADGDVPKLFRLTY